MPPTPKVRAQRRLVKRAYLARSSPPPFVLPGLSAAPTRGAARAAWRTRRAAAYARLLRLRSVALADAWQEWRFDGPFPSSALSRVLRAYREAYAGALSRQLLAEVAAHLASAEQLSRQWARTGETFTEYV